jgi:DNA (cytosine-5)-methyltransferase 1
MFVPVQTFSTPAIGSIREDVLSSCITKNTGGGGETQNPAFVLHPVYELHSQDSRVRELGDVCTTVSATYGSGGGNVPITLAQPIAYALDSLASNSMKSANPASGCNAVDVSKALDTSRGLDPSCNQGGMAVAVALPIAFGGKMSFPHTDVDIMQTLQAKNPMAVCLGGQHPNAGIGIDQSPTLTNAMGAGGGHIPITNAMAVRRLTPKECERLQGFPDNYTDIKLKGKPTPDGPRYKALGNSMAVPVMAWIGKRIQEVESLLPQRLESIPAKKNP